jgi:hypothetical protein
MEGRLFGFRLKSARGPADGVALNPPGGLRARAQVHGAGVTVALPGRALHAAAARHRVVRVEHRLGRQRARQDAEQQRRGQYRLGDGAMLSENLLPGGSQDSKPFGGAFEVRTTRRL